MLKTCQCAWNHDLNLVWWESTSHLTKHSLWVTDLWLGKRKRTFRLSFLFASTSSLLGRAISWHREKTRRRQDKIVLVNCASSHLIPTLDVPSKLYLGWRAWDPLVSYPVDLLTLPSLRPDPSCPQRPCAYGVSRRFHANEVARSSRAHDCWWLSHTCSSL